ncbi:MAG: hypothetical protein ACXW3D_01485 [Caulobacteraceae bacterium]
MADLNPALLPLPEAFPHSYDPLRDRVLVARLSEARIKAASFLDQRVLTPETEASWFEWADLEPFVHAAAPAERLGFIFHLGHVGSTLVSRLLGSHPSVLSLREPAALRTFATLPPSSITQDRLTALLRLWSRPFHAGQLPIIKATSFCSEMAAGLLARPSQPRAAFVMLQPEPYLATIIGGENNHLDIGANAEARLKRLNARVGGDAWRLAGISYGEAVAMSWAAEMTALEAAGSERALWIDFDRVLADPDRQLARAFAHFERPVTQHEIAAIVAGPELRRYAKGPEHAYDAALRNAVLDQARSMAGAEIKRGLAWLDSAAKAHPIVEQALMRRPS